ncbi:MAG: ABC transporter permease [Acidobacteria bacterium]|nr:ABC transporter permease [Acidobacteriota bacterium]
MRGEAGLHHEQQGPNPADQREEHGNSWQVLLRSLRDALAFAYDALRVNKVRTGLTALGMAIGTGSVILVVTIAMTSRDYVLGQIEAVGSNLINAHLEGTSSVTGSVSLSDALNLGDLQAIRQQVPNLAAVSAVIVGDDRIRLEHQEREIRLIGANPDFRIVRNLKVLAGRFFDEEDDRLRNKVCLITEPLAKILFPDGWVSGQKIKLHGLEFTIIGVFKEGAETFGQSEITRETAMLPIAVMTYFTGSAAVDNIYASADRPSNVQAATDEILQVIRSRHRGSAMYRVDNLTQILAAAGNIAMALTVVLLMVSAIALIISGIGIMNIMLVTVTERTREIGLRMALGAGRHAVRMQFLTEALFLSLMGGVVGIAGGVSLPLLARYFVEGFQIPISKTSILVALLVSCLCGIVFGIIPAERAAKLNPTEALRYE